MTRREIYQGDTINFQLNCKDESTNNILDITGYAFYLTVKNNLSNDDIGATIQKDVSVHPNAANGITNIVILPTETATISGNYYYDIKYKDPDGNIGTVEAGNLVIHPAITRRIPS